MSDLVYFLHPSQWRPLEYTDLAWGVCPRGSSADMILRVRNDSALYVARGVSVDVVATGGDEPSVAQGHLLSADAGVTFTPTVPVGDLPPQAISPLLTLRRITAPDAPLGAATFHLRVQVTSWQ